MLPREDGSFAKKAGVARFAIAVAASGPPHPPAEFQSCQRPDARSELAGFDAKALQETLGYCNGAVVARWESSRISNVRSDLMFTRVVGGWDNNALADAKLPDGICHRLRRLLATKGSGFTLQARRSKIDPRVAFGAG